MLSHSRFTVSKTLIAPDFIKFIDYGKDNQRTVSARTDAQSFSKCSRKKKGMLRGFSRALFELKPKKWLELNQGNVHMCLEVGGEGCCGWDWDHTRRRKHTQSHIDMGSNHLPTTHNLCSPANDISSLVTSFIKDRNNNTTYLIEFWWGLNSILNVKLLALRHWTTGNLCVFLICKMRMAIPSPLGC